jgi:hypothetical protein
VGRRSRGNRGNAWYVKIRARFIEQRGGRCARCGSVERLEFAHIVENGLNGRGRGRNNRIRDWVNSPRNYRLLCHGCHFKFDRTLGTKVLTCFLSSRWSARVHAVESDGPVVCGRGPMTRAFKTTVATEAYWEEVTCHDCLRLRPYAG